MSRFASAENFGYWKLHDAHLFISLEVAHFLVFPRIFRDNRVDSVDTIASAGKSNRTTGYRTIAFASCQDYRCPVRPGHWRARPQSFFPRRFATHTYRMDFMSEANEPEQIGSAINLADSWTLHPNQNPIFAGGTPLVFMVQNGPPGLATVRRLLDSISPKVWPKHFRRECSRAAHREVGPLLLPNLQNS